jgi:hypothetical protein
LVINDPNPPFGDTHPLTYSDTAVDFANDFYHYRVDAFSVLVGEAEGGSPQTGVGPSNIIFIGTGPDAATLSGNKINNNQLDLSWVNGTAGVLPIFSTDVYRSVNSGPFTLLANVLMPLLVYSDTTVDNGVNVYDYYVVSKDVLDTESANSNTVNFGLTSRALVAVNGGGLIGEQVALSFDAGRSWALQTGASIEVWNGVAWAPELPLLVAVSSAAGSDAVMTSPNGVNWTTRTPATERDWKDVAWSPTLMLFAAVADTLAGNRVMTSPDGENWTSRVTPADLDWDVIRWIPFLGLFIAGANGSASADQVMTSDDGTTWTRRTTVSGSASCMADSGSRVAIRSQSNFFGVITDNGISYTSAGAENSGCRGMAFGDGLFIVVGPNSATRQSSSDGLAWSNVTMPGNPYLAVVFDDDSGDFIAVGSDADVATSADGLSWAEQAAVLPAGNWNAVIIADLIP